MGSSKLIAMAAAVALAVTVVSPTVLARDVLFLGVTDVRGEFVQPELEGELRAGLAADRRFRLLGVVETERVVREMMRQGRTPAEETDIPRNAGLADSTVVIRGVVRELSVVVKRSPWLLWGKLDARMRLEMNFSELSGQAFHRGEFSASASKRKDIILFRDPKKVVHISVMEREELLGQIRTQLVKDAVSLAGTFFSALSPDTPPPKASGEGAVPAAAPGAEGEFSTVDGKDMTPIDSAGGGTAGGEK
jgi:hypothetical protein